MKLRIINNTDLDSLYNLSLNAGKGLTTLPADKAELQKKINNTQRTINFPPNAPNGDSILFVLVDDNDKVVGVSGAYTKVGGYKPFWTYDRLLTDTSHEYLQLKKVYDGPSEIGTLFLDKAYRYGNNGRLLSLSRFLFIAEFSHMFEDTIVAELRGTFDANGNSVFWDTICAPFFNMSFEHADKLINKDKTFIEELMPKFPIYTKLLPPSVQEVLGKVHPDSLPAMKLLQSENFNVIDEIDIFEGGPILTAQCKDIRTIKDSVKSKFIVSHLAFKSTIKYIIANVNSISEFNVVIDSIIYYDGIPAINEDTVNKLQLKPGDNIRYCLARNIEE